MTESVYQQYILDTIDHLRHRKARPDSERIFHALTKKYSLSYNEAKTALERAVLNGSVLRVEYKGNISYRNAAKKNLKRESLGENPANAANGKTNCSRKFTGLVTNSIAELVLQEPDYLELGVPAQDLVKNILSKDSVKYTKKYVSILLDKEVEIGGLIKMENGNFLVGPAKNEGGRRPPSAVVLGAGVAVTTRPRETEDAPEERTSGMESGVKLKRKPGPKPMTVKSNSSLGIATHKMENRHFEDANGHSRVGGRRKKAKKVFDPSDSNIPKKRGRPAGSLNKTTIEKQLGKLSDSDSRPESRSSLNGRDQGGVCSVCHLQNKKGPNDRMIACRECSNKAHFSCLNGGDAMLKMYPDNTWQCPHCKTCVVCFETSDAGYLAVCSVCADAYHMACHQPRIMDKPRSDNKWLCVNCQMPDQLAINDIQIGFGKIDAMPTLAHQNGCPNSNKSSEYDFHKENDYHQRQRLKEYPEDDLIEGDRSPYADSSSGSIRSLNSSPTPPTLSPQPTNLIMRKERSPVFSDVAKCGNNSDNSRFSIKEEEDEDIDPSIPDASNWNYDDVYNYFRKFFAEDEARIFKDQEIDGRSLLLLRRPDIVQNFKVKLGTALKMFKHVIRLQYRRDDPKLYWL